MSYYDWVHLEGDFVINIPFEKRRCLLHVFGISKNPPAFNVAS